MSPESTALVLIDMQNGFISPESPLCIAGAANTIAACARALDIAREHGMQVFHVRRSYAADGSDVEAARRPVWEQGGRPLSPGCNPAISADAPAELAELSDEHVVVKPRYSAFFGTGLERMLADAGVRTVVLAGTTTPNCVRATCYDALSWDYEVAVLVDATSSNTPQIQEANLADMQRVGARLLTVGDFAAEA